MKVLIAIKSEPLTDLLACSLPQHDVHICHSGCDALTQIEALHPDILLLELSLPGMDGITVLRKSRYRPQIILALTSLVNHSVLMDAAAVGVQDILPIPCTIRHIMEHLNVLLEP